MARSKGSIDDVNFIITAGWAVAFIFLIFAVMLTAFNAEIQSNPQVTANAKTAVGNLTTNGIAVLFNSIPLVIFGLYFVALLLASRVGNHPAFIVFSLLFAGISIILASVFGYAFMQIANKPAFAAVLVNYPQVTFIFDNYAFIVAIMLSLMFIVLYSKLYDAQNARPR